MRQRRRLLSEFLVAGLVVFAGACSSSDNESSASSSSKSSSNSTRSESSHTARSDGGGNAGDCLSAAATYTNAGGELDALLAGRAGDLDTSAHALDAYANEAPSAIRADMRTLATAYNALAQVIQDLGYQVGQVPSADQAQQLREASDAIDTDEVKAADDRVSAFFDNNCQG